MSSNFVRFQETLNQALAENFSCLTQKLANPPLKSGSSFPNRHPLFKFFFKNILATALKSYIKWLLYFFFFFLKKLKKVEKIGYHSRFKQWFWSEIVSVIQRRALKTNCIQNWGLIYTYCATNAKFQTGEDCKCRYLLDLNKMS